MLKRFIVVRSRDTQFHTMDYTLYDTHWFGIGTMWAGSNHQERIKPTKKITI